jgi:hypothetical protein
VLAPAALAALSTTFGDPKERAKAFSIYGAIGASGAAIGLLLGGALTQWASWRWCLFINLFFAAIAIVGVVFFVAGARRERSAHLDVFGTLLGSAGLFFVVYGFAHAVNTGWGNVITWGSLVIGVALLVAFVRWEQRSKNPLLPLRLLINRVRGGSLVALFLTSIGIFGISLFLAYYLQGTLGYSPLRTGVAFLPLVAAIALSAFIASARLLAVSGPRPLIPTGMLLSTKLSPDADYFSNVLPGLVVTGLGLGLIFAPAIASATAGVRASDAGAASALVNTTQQIGGSMGLALLNTIAVSVTARSNRVPVALSERFTRHEQVHHAAVLATLHGYAVAFWWAAAFFGAGAIFTFGLLESGVPEHDAGVPALS